MEKAIDMAKYIVTKCYLDKVPVSNMQLQKILYYIQRSFLKSGEFAFDDEIEAWAFGPVIPEVYYIFCGYGSRKIEIIYSVFLENKITEKIDPIIESKRTLMPWDMIDEMQKIDGAWDRTYCGGGGNKKVIDPILIRILG